MDSWKMEHIGAESLGASCKKYEVYFLNPIELIQNTKNVSS